MNPKVEKELKSIIDLEELSLLKKFDPGFSIMKLFNPHLSKMVHYNSKPVISCDVDTFIRRFGIKADKRILAVIDEFYEQGFNPVLAGGKMISFINGETIEDSDNDYDIYFTSDIDSNHLSNHLHDQRKDVHIVEWLDGTSYLDEFLYKSSLCKEMLKIQIMVKPHPFIESLITGFDFRCCAVAYHRGRIYWVKGAIKDIREKSLKALSPRPDTKSFLRIIKYCQRGYDILGPDLLAFTILNLEPIIVNGDNLNQQIVQMMADRAARWDRALTYNEDMAEEAPALPDPEAVITTE